MSGLPRFLLRPLASPNAGYYRYFERLCFAIGVGSIGATAFVPGAERSISGFAVGGLLLAVGVCFAAKASEVEDGRS